jgi:hypothetical protein
VGCEVLSPSLVHLTRLQHLDFSRNSLSGHGFKSLWSSLVHLTRLQYLGLGSNNTDRDSVCRLVPFLLNMPLLGGEGDRRNGSEEGEEEEEVKWIEGVSLDKNVSDCFDGVHDDAWKQTGLPVLPDEDKYIEWSALLQQQHEVSSRGLCAEACGQSQCELCPTYLLAHVPTSSARCCCTLSHNLFATFPPLPPPTAHAPWLTALKPQPISHQIPTHIQQNPHSLSPFSSTTSPAGHSRQARAAAVCCAGCNLGLQRAI